MGTWGAGSDENDHTAGPAGNDTRPCAACDGGDDEGLVLLCDLCDTPYHTHCVGFQGRVEGDWLCGPCAAESPAEEHVVDDAV